MLVLPRSGTGLRHLRLRDIGPPRQTFWLSASPTAGLAAGRCARLRGRASELESKCFRSACGPSLDCNPRETETSRAHRAFPSRAHGDGCQVRRPRLRRPGLARRATPPIRTRQGASDGAGLRRRVTLVSGHTLQPLDLAEMETPKRGSAIRPPARARRPPTTVAECDDRRDSVAHCYNTPPTDEKHPENQPVASPSSTAPARFGADPSHSATSADAPRNATLLLQIPSETTS